MRARLSQLFFLFLLISSFMLSCNKEDEAVNPDICFEMTEGELYAEMTVNFDASCSPGTFEMYAWDFGDGNTGTGIQASNVYDEPGQYTVVLSVGKYGEQLRSISKKINVLPSPFIKHCDDIEGDEVWEEGMHLVNCDITVNGSLTIKPGASIYMSSQRSIDVTGKLIAQGTESKPIKFLPADNSTNPGAWGHIRFSSTASAESILDYCEISYGGVGSTFFYPHFEYSSTSGTIQIQECEVSITNTTVKGASAYGINLTENARLKAFENNTIVGSGKNPLRLYAAALHMIGGTTTLTGEKDILVMSPQYLTLTSDVTWYKQDVPYHLDGRIDLLGNYSITVQPGTVIKLTSEGLSDNAYINGGSGGLKAIGTAAEPIIFTSAEAEKNRGDWGGLLVGNNSVLKHCTIEYAGAEYRFGYHRNVAISGNAVVENCLIQEGSGIGIQVSYTEGAAIRNNTIKNFNGAAVATDVNDQHVIELSNILENTEGFQMVGAASADITLIKRPYPYICGGITLRNGLTLTIEAGTNIEMLSGAYISMGYDNAYTGNLVANGTAAAPITVSLWSKDKAAGKGNWGAITFGQTSTTSVMNYCVLTDGGKASDGRANFGVIHCYKTAGFPAITNSTISNSATYGMALTYGSTVTSSGNTFSNNVSGDVYTD